MNAGESLTTTVANWSRVREKARSVAASGLPDAEVIAWLMEADLRLGGFSALADSCRLAVQLVQPNWPDIYSADMSSPEVLMEPFSGLNGISAEGSLIQPIRLSPLVPGYPFGAMNLWDWQRAERNPASAEATEFNETIAALSHDRLREHVRSVIDCRKAFQEMTAAFEVVCGAAAPSSSFTLTALEEAEHAARRIYRTATGEELTETLAATGTDGQRETRREPSFDGVIPFVPKAVERAPAEEAPQPTPARKDIETREDAFTELLRIASFFRRTEPHSPISYTIETIVRRGRMPLPDLLTELVPDPDVRARILTTAGIQTIENKNI